MSTTSDPLVWAQNPLFSAHAKLRIGAIHALEDSGTLAIDDKTIQTGGARHVLKCLHPLWKAQVCGTLVAWKRGSKMLQYLIDDGTGILGCLEWIDDDDEEEDEFDGKAVAVGKGVNCFSSAFSSEFERPVGLSTHQKSRCRLGDCVFAFGALDFPPDYLWGRKNSQAGIRQLILSRPMQTVRDPALEVLFWLECERLKRRVYSSELKDHIDSERVFELAGSANAPVVKRKKKRSKRSDFKSSIDDLLKRAKIVKTFHKPTDEDGHPVTCFRISTMLSNETHVHAEYERHRASTRQRTLEEALISCADDLVSSGKAYKVNDDLYVYITHDFSLSPAICVLLQERGPLTEEGIVSGVADAFHTLNNVSAARIRESISRLVESSDVYRMDERFALTEHDQAA